MTDFQASHYIFLPHLAPAWCKAFWKEGIWANLFSLYLSSSPSSLSSLFNEAASGNCKVEESWQNGRQKVQQGPHFLTSMSLWFVTAGLGNCQGDRHC